MGRWRELGAAACLLGGLPVAAQGLGIGVRAARRARFGDSQEEDQHLNLPEMPIEMPRSATV